MTAPARTHAEDPARRMVGESFRNYADRIYGMYRALVTDMERLREIERCARVAAVSGNVEIGELRITWSDGAALTIPAGTPLSAEGPALDWAMRVSDGRPVRLVHAAPFGRDGGA